MKMSFCLFCWLVFLAGLLIQASLRTGAHNVSRRMVRFSKGMDRLLLSVPVLAAAVFAVLFCFVLKGRFYERLCHAVLVLALWLCAARFYWFLISYSGYWKKKHGSIFCRESCDCLFVMTGAAFSAILLTPLDQYIAVVHSFLGPASILPGAGLLAVFYAASHLAARAPRGKEEAKEGERAFLDGRDADAFRLFSEAAKAGSAAGQYGLGGCYATGTGVKKNKKEAVKWYRMAAEQGHRTAMYDLSVCCMNGEGVEKNEAEAMKWLHRSAELGDGVAQLILGACYAKGNGVGKNETEAVKWFGKAAKQGVAPAQVELGKRYAEGIGVEKDGATALKWYRKAARQGDEDAKAALEQMRR